MEAQVTLLDVVPVAPKDRFESIMSAWQALTPEGVLELNVDHDPSCMYYTLRATQGEAAFTFEYVERGPLFWRVRLTKRAA
jgi:regulator of cell morphogenesis and NO signaling